MADPSVGTRAPENDANEDQSTGGPSQPTPTATAAEKATPASTSDQSTASKSFFPNDTAVEPDAAPLASPADHSNCTSDRPAPPDAPPPAGEITTLNGVECYVTKPASYPSSPGKLLLLLTGGTGLNSRNNQLQADVYATRGFVVVMPDQFNGDKAPNVALLTDAEARDAATSTAAANEDAAAVLGRRRSSGIRQGLSLLERIKLGVAESAKSFLIDMWLARHTPEKVFPLVKKALEGAEEAFADAVANGGGVYGVGYCFGAKYILLLSHQPSGNPKPAKSTEDKAEEAAEGPGGAFTVVDPDAEDGVGVDEDSTSRPDQPAASTSASTSGRTSTTPRPRLKRCAIAHGTLVTRDDLEGVRAPLCMVCVRGDNLFPDEVREQGKAALELNGVDHEVHVHEDVPHGFAVLGDYADAGIQEAQSKAFEEMCGFLNG